MQLAFLNRHFCEARAKEFAHHGFARRLKTLARCIENVFTLIPPDQAEPPENAARYDAEINIQASVFNTFAAADNLARIWIVEKGVTQNGRPIQDTWVGLRSNNRAVRDSMSQEFRDYLAGLDPWFNEINNFRHALAHGIPLYIPPFVIKHDNEETYRDLEDSKLRALVSGDLAEHDRLNTEQKKLEVFVPCMQHSFYEDTRPLVFHPQLLANFSTIEQIGYKILEELDR